MIHTVQCRTFCDFKERHIAADQVDFYEFNSEKLTSLAARTAKFLFIIITETIEIALTVIKYLPFSFKEQWATRKFEIF